jgi:hypothetical protein
MDHDHSHHNHHNHVAATTTVAPMSHHDHHDMDHSKMDHSSMDHSMHAAVANGTVSHAMHHMMEMAVSIEIDLEAYLSFQELLDHERFAEKFKGFLRDLPKVFVFFEGFLESSEVFRDLFKAF